jgi:hypothetical protein
MLMLIILAAAAVVISWGLVMAVVVAVLDAQGLAWPVAAGILAGVHALAGVAAWQFVVRLSRNLSLPALRASLVPPAERSAP